MARDSVTEERERCHLHLLGCWDLRVSGETIELGVREQRLLALLALRGRRPRTYVAGTLWPNSTEDHALTSLRTAILRSRRAVPSILDVGRSNVALHPAVRVDVHDMLRVAEHGDGPVPNPKDSLAVLSAGDLLPGWYDDWVLFEKERLQHLRLRALETLGASQLASGHPDLALAAALEAIAVEPLRETAHALVIRAHLATGNPSAAIHAFRHYRGRLQQELGIAPSRELADLVRPLLPARA